MKRDTHLRQRDPTLEEREGPVVRVEYHLLGLARICPDERQAEPGVCDLERQRHTVDQRQIMTSVELVSLTQRIAHRREGRDRRRDLFLAPAKGIATDSRHCPT